MKNFVSIEQKTTCTVRKTCTDRTVPFTTGHHYSAKKRSRTCWDYKLTVSSI